MRTIRTTLAAMLTILTLAASYSDAQAQTRRSTTTSRTSSSNDRKAVSSRRQTTKPSTSGTSDRKTTRPATRPATRPTTRPTVTPSKDRNPASASTVTRPAVTPSTDRNSARPSVTTRPATRPSTRPSVTPSPDRKPTGPSATTRPAPPASKPITVVRPGHNTGGRGPGDSHLPPRIHPRDRDFMHYSTPSYFWTGHNHCYGHRVRVIPSYAHRHVHHGITYYCHNDIWYRPFGGHYVVCRPPFGTVLAANLIADMAWAAVTLSYYNTVADTFSQINENNEYIAQQNAVIAQNNALIASQNAQIASGQTKAHEAYLVADRLGLVQSYAAAGSSYYYQDGVFYVSDSDGTYKVILPPAGALVETLSEDYDMVTLADGKEYYKVDDTIFRVTINEGKPWFEVLGQLYD